MLRRGPGIRRTKTALLGFAAVAALVPSLAFAMDTQGGDGGSEPAEGSSPAPRQHQGGGVVQENSHDDEVSIGGGDPLQGQPHLTVKIPGLCKLLNCK